jgi:hypothetical protein
MFGFRRGARPKLWFCGALRRGTGVAEWASMIRRFVGISLICSSLLAGCVTTTTTQTCFPGPGGICGEETTTQSSWPSSNDSPSHSSESADYTGAIVAASMAVTAIALIAVLRGRSHNDDHEKVPQQHAVTDADLRLERMYAQAHLSARAGRCEAVVAIGKKLAREQPQELERYASDREIAVCLPPPVTASVP